MGMGSTLYTESNPKKASNRSAIITRKRMNALFYEVCVCGTICWLARGQSWQFKPTYTDAQKALFMAVCVGFEPTERYSRSRFSKPAHLPLCQHTLWQELKDSNPYKMIWNHLCYRYTKSLKMAGTARIELATHRLTVCRSTD